MTLFAPFHIVHLIVGFQKFIRTQKNTVGHYQSLIQAFCISLGRTNTWLSRRISKLYPPSFKFNGTGVLSNVNFDEVNAQLNDKGFYIFKDKLNDETIERLLEFSKKNQSTTRIMSDGKKSPINLFYDPQDKKAVRYDYKEDDLINDAAVQNLMTDSSILQIAQNYLQTTPIADVIGMWWNTDFQKEPDSEAAQYYHFDMDRIKWLKFFFYLTDVEEDKGPHSFVEGSHKDGGIPFSMTAKGYARLSDEEVLSHYGKERVKVFAAPKGTIIAEDTRGLHKGSNVINGDRLIFQMQFSNLLFGAQYKKSHLNLKNSDLLSSFDRENPRVLMNYR